MSFRSLCFASVFFLNGCNFVVYTKIIGWYSEDTNGNGEIDTSHPSYGYDDTPGSNLKQIPLIINGKEVNPTNKYPWQCSLRYYFTELHFCGCSLIADQWVITAAHCAEAANKDWDIAVLGMYDQSMSKGNPETYELIEVYVHEEYNKTELTNDIALFKLSKPISKNNSHIKSINLGIESENYSSCVVTGWGATEYPNVQVNEELLEAPVELMDSNECIEILKKEGYGEDTNSMTDKQICALNELASTCKGDSGGPLSCLKNDKEWELVGITSWGESCNVSIPAVYTRILSYTKWINSKIMSDSGFSTESPVLTTSNAEEAITDQNESTTEKENKTDDLNYDNPKMAVILWAMIGLLAVIPLAYIMLAIMVGSAMG